MSSYTFIEIHIENQQKIIDIGNADLKEMNQNSHTHLLRQEEIY
jgi:hypothetical protein